MYYRHTALQFNIGWHTTFCTNDCAILLKLSILTSLCSQYKILTDRVPQRKVIRHYQITNFYFSYFTIKLRLSERITQSVNITNYDLFYMSIIYNKNSEKLNQLKILHHRSIMNNITTQYLVLPTYRIKPIAISLLFYI